MAARRGGGFTLLEVLVAMAIFAVVALALLNTGRDQLQTSGRLEDKTFAHWVAMNRIAEMQLSPQAPALGRATDTVSMAGQKWHLQIQVDPTPTASVHRITVDVSHAAADFSDDRPVITSLTAFAGNNPHAQQAASTSR